MKKHIMFIGERETFLARVLIGKLEDADMDCYFVPLDVDEIDMHWMNTDLIILYMDEGERPKEDVMHFLVDRMVEEGMVMLPIGEKSSIQYIQKMVPAEIIHQVFIRPLDNTAFVKAVSEVLRKMDEGEFRKQLLVVDDDPNYLGLVREWLKEDYKVAMVNSGLQAIKWLGKNKADLILLDHEMPVTSGPKVLEMLRSDPETRNIPVIFLTGKGDKDSVMQVVALKPEGYFLKTIQRQELLAKLDEFFMLQTAK